MEALAALPIGGDRSLIQDGLMRRAQGHGRARCLSTETRRRASCRAADVAAPTRPRIMSPGRRRDRSPQGDKSDVVLLFPVAPDEPFQLGEALVDEPVASAAVLDHLFEP